MTFELTLDCHPRHRFLEPIHNVKDEAFVSLYRGEPRIRFLHSWKVFGRHYVAGATVVVEPVGIEPTTSSLQS